MFDDSVTVVDGYQQQPSQHFANQQHVMNMFQNGGAGQRVSMPQQQQVYHQDIGGPYGSMVNGDFLDDMSMCFAQSATTNHNELMLLPGESARSLSDLMQQPHLNLSQQQQQQHFNQPVATSYYQCSYAEHAALSQQALHQQQLHQHQYQQDYASIDDLEPSLMLVEGHQAQAPAVVARCEPRMAPDASGVPGAYVQPPPAYYVQQQQASAQVQQQHPAYQHSSPTGSTHTSSGSTDLSEDADEMFGYTPVYKQKSTNDNDLNRGNVKGKRQIKKRKPKKDPNEPQKPVSAYALFFRDTQATIKGKSPNASFGEVSKIVASMWDGLDTDSKNMYKQKTESAKKDYLKQLATYRANLLSKSGLQSSADLFTDSQFGRPIIPQRRQSAQAGVCSPLPDSTTGVAAAATARLGGVTGAAASRSMSAKDAAVADNVGHKSLASLIAEPAPQQVLTATTTLTVPQAYSLNRNKVEYKQTDGECQGSVCVRSGCTKQAINSPQWDKEYCSNECVVKHCRDAFGVWVRNRQSDGGEGTFAPV